MKQLMELLERDMLTNVSLLKMIQSYPGLIECRFIEKGGHSGALLLLPTTALPYDRLTYPDADYAVFLDCTDVELIPELLPYIPAGSRVIFKLQRPSYARKLAEWCNLQKARSFYSYTSLSGATGSIDPHVVISGNAEANAMPLWLDNGYEEEEIRSYFQNGASSFTMYEDGLPVSSCLVFQNYKRIWEIGAVHTRAEWRGRGLAKRVVGAAVFHLKSRELMPRYQVLETNRASIRLAESAGLIRFVELSHYIARRV